MDRLLKLIIYLNLLDYHGNRPAPEEPIETPDNALGQGYGESKWVSEKILEAAAAKTALKPTVVRLGQITGGPSGYWNEHEWLPSLIKSSAYLKMLPDAQGVSKLLPLTCMRFMKG